jgi:hypothetical protein
MSAFRQGEWAILSVEVDTDKVLDQEQYQRLEIDGDQLTIQPSGMKFKVQQSTSRSAVLESRGQVFFADFVAQEQDQMCLELSRPQFSERIRINAMFHA